jgi:hypothetical protein
MNTLEEWKAAVCADLGLDPACADTTIVLDVARDVAHGVARPAAPLTAYLLGVAVGQGMTLPDAAGRISALADDWRAPDAPGESPRSPTITITGLLQLLSSPGVQGPVSRRTESRGGIAGRAKGGP